MMEKYIRDGGTLYQLSCGWEELTHIVLGLEELPADTLQELVDETYRDLSVMHKEELVPKNVCRLFMSIRDFLYFAELMEEKETGKGYYHCEELNYLMNAVIKGFMSSEYRAAYPELIVTDCMDTDYLIDFSKDSLRDYFAAVRSQASQET